VQTATLCSERYSKDHGTRSAQIEASFRLFHGGVKGDEQQIHEDQDRFCSNKYGPDYLASLGITQCEILSPAAVDAVSTCYANESRKFKLTRLTSVTPGFSADFLHSGAGAIDCSAVKVIKPDLPIVQYLMDLEQTSNVISN
jgi:hypothetical protein